jgi:hypothetical protein
MLNYKDGMQNSLIKPEGLLAWQKDAKTDRDFSIQLR